MSDKPKSFIVDQERFLLPVGRMILHDLFTPRAFKEGQDAKYGCRVMWEPDADFSTYQAALQRMKTNPDFMKITVSDEEAARQVASGVEEHKINTMRNILKYGKNPIEKVTKPDIIEKYPYQAGKLIGTARSKFPPTLIDAKKQVINEQRKEELYNGCYVRPYVQLIYFAGLGGGFSLSLTAVQKVKDGEMLRGKGTVNLDLFDAYSNDAKEQELGLFEV